MVNPSVVSVGVSKTTAQIGDSIDVDITITNLDSDSGMIRVRFEDILNGATVGGRSMITEIGPNETITVSFSDYTLRYAGTHQICGYAEPY